MAKRSVNGLTTGRLKELARRGAEVALKELRADIVAIERTFPEIRLRGSRHVTSTSSAVGVGSPDGWLWHTTIAAALASSAALKTSRGCTSVESSVPRLTSW